MLVKSSPATCDEKLIREVLGDSHASTLSEIAHAFDVKETTVRNTWRRGDDKIPGDSTRGGKGKFPWADCVVWFLRRNAAAAEGRGVDEFTKRKREAETLQAEAEAEIKQRKAQREAGHFIELHLAVSVVKGYANRLRDGLMSIAREIAPMFPAKHAKQWAADLETKHRNLLIAFSEASISDLHAEAERENGSSDYVRGEN